MQAKQCVLCAVQLEVLWQINILKTAELVICSNAYAGVISECNKFAIG